LFSKSRAASGRAGGGSRLLQRCPKIRVFICDSSLCMRMQQIQPETAFLNINILYLPIIIRNFTCHCSAQLVPKEISSPYRSTLHHHDKASLDSDVEGGRSKSPLCPPPAFPVPLALPFLFVPLVAVFCVEARVSEREERVTFFLFLSFFDEFA
jgi:hypothetical protein